MEDVIELRGHHIDVLAEFYFRRLENEANKSDSIYAPKHETILGRSFLYTEETSKKHTALYELMLGNPDLQIQLVDGADSVCRLCNRLSEPCGSNPSQEEIDQDRDSAEQFGLEFGRLYTVREVLEKIITFHERTGRISPRTEDFKYHPEEAPVY